MGNRRLRSATNFFRFSPLCLQLRLLPKWVFLSLGVNGLLAALLLGVSLHPSSLPAASSGSALADSSHAASVPPPQSLAAELGPRHQLSYNQWVDVLAQEAKAAAERPPKRLTVLAGDSISLWFPNDLLPLNRAWLNQGISGETSTGLLKRLDLLDSTKPETIFVMIGINDLIRGADDSTVLDNEEQIVRYLNDEHPQSQIVVQSILPHAGKQVTWEGRDRLLSISNSRIRALNKELKAIADAEDVYFLDLYPLFADADGNLRPELTTDGLHLSPKGYQVWSTALQLYSQITLEPAKKEASQ
jgi:lysophospholipase L1-like esterase